jgi:hypothetical protein
MPKLVFDEAPPQRTLAFDPPAVTAPAAGPRPAAAVQAEYNDKPWYAKAGQAVDDTVRMIANGASLGYADKLAGYMNGTGTQAERALSQEAKDRAGGAGTAAEVIGAVMTPMAAARNGASLMPLAGSMPGVSGTLARSGLAAVEGAGYGGVGAAGNDQNVANGIVNGAAFGAAGNAGAEALIKGAKGVSGMFAAKPTVPSMGEVTQGAKDAYRATDDLGVMYSPQYAERLNNGVRDTLADFGYDPALHPGAKAVIDRLEALQGQNTTFKGVDSIRRVANQGYKPGEKGNNAIVSKIVGLIDNSVAAPQAGDVLAGDSQAAAEAVAKARELFSRSAKADSIGNAAERAGRNAAASGTGWNEENALRASLKSLRNDPNAMRGFKPDEIELLDKAIAGTPDQNLLRHIGRLAPTGVLSAGIGMGGGSAIGTAIGGPVGTAVGATAVPAVGFAARMGATKMEENSISQLLDVILSGGTKAGGLPKPTGVQQALTANQDDILAAVFGADQKFALGTDDRKRKMERR